MPDFPIGFFLVVLLLFGMIGGVAGLARWSAEERCKTLLASHGYEYGTSKVGGWFTSDECWGFKDGVPIRVY